MAAMNVAVIGAGSWGTALALVLARNGHEVVLMGRNPEDLAAMTSVRENLRYLPGFVMPDSVRFSLLGDPDGVEPDLWVMAVPSGAVRGASECLGRTTTPILVAAKGLELGTGRLMSEVVAESCPLAPVAAISGPNLAIELARGIPTISIVASENEALADSVRSAFASSALRVYITADLIGVELAGSLKNVLAIAAGMSDGLGYGDNTKGAMLARGLGEMMRLGRALGAMPETFVGVAGVGDLFATANSKLSRNYRLGVALGSGKKLEDALRDLGQVAEGVPTSEAVMKLARLHQVEMKIFEMAHEVIRGRIEPRAAVTLLMERTPKYEGLAFSGS
ncbi:MAG: Glycerol-3-phosphate dehydrogenase [NAD(P)+] [Fimbriimonadaceae bacterium]|nr:Glycerol-3-phosphate dehydrogenase [NAD(P)+] [Fimbriimonadaceae bacterium]